MANRVPSFIRDAYATGEYFCENGSGYVLHLHLKSGNVVKIAPQNNAVEVGEVGHFADENGSNYVPFDAVEYIHVEEVK
jgi:hypothetical protein